MRRPTPLSRTGATHARAHTQDWPGDRPRRAHPHHRRRREGRSGADRDHRPPGGHGRPRRGPPPDPRVRRAEVTATLPPAHPRGRPGTTPRVSRRHPLCPCDWPITPPHRPSANSGRPDARADVTPPEPPAAVCELAAEIRLLHRAAIRELRIELTDGGAVLHGRASSFYGKQLAFHEVTRRGRLTVIANRVVVDY